MKGREGVGQVCRAMGAEGMVAVWAGEGGAGPAEAENRRGRGRGGTGA